MRSEAIKISPNGEEISFVYTDEMAPLVAQGSATVNRASHVEPVPGGGWQADLTPVGGPILTGFDLRGEALGAEIDWLNENLFGGNNA